MATLRFTKDQLIEALEARREWAQQLDAANLAKHQAEEKAALAKFRQECKEALKWDYQTAKSNWFRVGKVDRPHCPSSLVASLDRHLNQVKASYQTRYTISESGGWSQVHHLLTHDETIKTEMC